MASVIAGFVSVVLGVWGVWIWRDDFFIVLRGLVPLSLATAGVLAVFMGLAGMAEKRGKD